MKQPSIKNGLVAFLKCAVVIGALAYLIASDKLNISQMHVASGKWPVLLGAGVLVFLAGLLSFFRYWFLLRAVDAPMRLADVFRIGMIGMFFNTFMLGGVGGDVVKLAYVIRATGKRAGAVASVMIDRVLGLMGVIALGGIALLVSWPLVRATPSLHGLALGVFSVLGIAALTALCAGLALSRGRKPAFLLWGVCLLAWAAYAWSASASGTISFDPHADKGALMTARACAAFVLALLVSFLCILVVPSCQPGRRLEGFVRQRVPLGGKLMELIRAVLMYKDHPGILAMAFVLSLVVQLGGIFAVYGVARALRLEITPELPHIFFATPPTLVANSLPVPGGGLGVGEGAFDMILSLCRTKDGVAVVGGAGIFLVFRFLTVVSGLMGLPFYLVGKKELVAAEASYLQTLANDEVRAAAEGAAGCEAASQKADCPGTGSA